MSRLSEIIHNSFNSKIIEAEEEAPAETAPAAPVPAPPAAEAPATDRSSSSTVSRPVNSRGGWLARRISEGAGQSERTM